MGQRANNGGYGDMQEYLWRRIGFQVKCFGFGSVGLRVSGFRAKVLVMGVRV